jgi:hypothetical protein
MEVEDEVPLIPDQTAGPQFRLQEDGTIALAPSQGARASGNNVALLRLLHPGLLQAGKDLVSALEAKDNLYPILRERARNYLNALDKPLEVADFGLLYMEGVRLKNAADATQADHDIPEIRSSVEEPLNSVLRAHGAFVANSAVGTDLLAAEARYEHNPRKEAAFRDEAVQVANAIAKHPTIFAPAAAEVVAHAARESGRGDNPVRSTVVANTAVGNATITLAQVAVVAATFLASSAVTTTFVGDSLVGTGIGAVLSLPLIKALEKTKAMTSTIDLLRLKLDRLSGAHSAQHTWESCLSPYLNLLSAIGPNLRRIAQLESSFAWVPRALDWIDRKLKDGGKHEVHAGKAILIDDPASKPPLFTISQDLSPYRVAAREPALRSRWDPEVSGDLVLDSADGAYFHLKLVLKNTSDRDLLMVELSGEAKVHSPDDNASPYESDFLSRTILSPPPERIKPFGEFVTNDLELRVPLVRDKFVESAQGGFEIRVSIAFGWLTESHCEIASESYVLLKAGQLFSGADFATARIPKQQLTIR